MNPTNLPEPNLTQIIDPWVQPDPIWQLASWVEPDFGHFWPDKDPKPKYWVKQIKYALKVRFNCTALNIITKSWNIFLFCNSSSKPTAWTTDLAKNAQTHSQN